MIHLTYHKEKGGEKNKMDGMVSINTSTLYNSFCQVMRLDKKKVCSACYAHIGECFRKKTAQAFARNSEQMAGGIIPLDDLTHVDVPFARFHSHGELINWSHLKNLFGIAERNPQTSFTLWTKRPNIVQEFLKKKPSNLLLIFSSFYKNEFAELPRGFNKTFNVFSAQGIREGNIDVNCKGKCIECRKCYDASNKESVIREVLR